MLIVSIGELAGVALVLLICFFGIWGLLLGPIVLVARALNATVNRRWLLGSAVAAAVMLALPLVLMIALLNSCKGRACF